MDLSIVDIISLTASIASLVLAIVAIWLSWVFFNKSNEASEKTNEASRSIMSSVEKLEKLFDKLYSDTFGMMKETVTDMRKHFWNNTGDSNVEDELAKKTEEKVNSLKTELTNELSKVLSEQNKTGDKIHSLENSLSSLIEKAVIKTQDIESEAKEETLREYIFKTYKKIGKSKRIIADYIVDKAIEDGVNVNDLLDEITKMKEDGLLSFEGSKINNGTVEISFLKELNK